MTDNQEQPMDAEVAAAVLKAMQVIDRPAEMLEDEMFGHVMPRRLGLSGVVRRQLELYRERSRQGAGLGHEELAELIGLVTRRPDAGTILYMAGTYLADDFIPARGRWGTKSRRLRRAKRAIERGLKDLFGRDMGNFGGGSSRLRVADSLLARLDPSGDACAMITGFCQRALDRAVGEDLRIAKLRCRSDDEARPCIWRIESGVGVVEHVVDEEAGHRNVEPHRQRPAGQAAVALEAAAARQEQEPEH